MTNVLVDVLGFHEINKKNPNEVDYAQKKNNISGIFGREIHLHNFCNYGTGKNVRKYCI